MATRQTVCILGGTGFVGLRLASHLVAQGYSVRIPTRSRPRNRRLLVLPSVELVEADIHDERVLTRVLNGAQVAINLVGILNEKGHDGSGFHAAHAALVEKLIRACQECGVSRLLQMSALKANAERGPSHYLRTKGIAENTIKSLAGNELRYTIFQPSVIFGPGDSFTNRFAGLLKIAPLFPLAKPKSRLAPVYVEDVVSAFCAALIDPQTHGRTYQLCGPETFTLQEIVTDLARVLGIKRVVIGLPDSLSRLQAWAMDYLVPGKPFSLDNYRSLSVASVCTENGLAALGITATSMGAVVPSYLGARDRHQQVLARLRRSAGR
jgi:NADH dehydrogenase